MNFILRSLLLFSAMLLTSGCSYFAQSWVETQPRSNYSPEDIKNLSKIVEGVPVAYRIDLESSEEQDPDLLRYAPILVQGFQEREKTEYDYGADAIGNPYLEEEELVKINTKEPRVFCRIEHTSVYDQKVKQLVYALWYPTRPVGTVEQGNIDGHILRITLGANGSPVLYESTQSCGCFYGVFASEKLEIWAKKEFQRSLPHKKYVLEKKHESKSDWVIRGLVSLKEGERPVLCISKGQHFCQTILSSGEVNLENIDQKKYQLVDYEKLNQIPRYDGKTGSMFNDEGLVWGGRRWKEELIFTSLEYPGWPRHLDKVNIHWDEAKWQQPNLLMDYLRLPHAILETNIADEEESLEEGFSEETADESNKEYSPSVLSTSFLEKYGQEKPFAVLVTHKFCIGCHKFKETVLKDNKSQKALSNWNFVVIDLFQEEERKLVAAQRVSLTPTLILFSSQGKELLRMEGISTLAELNSSLGKAL